MCKIYIVSSSKILSGGTESLHQLASELKKLGYDVYMYYKNPHINEMVAKFKKYDVKVAKKIDDDKKNTIIVPETFTGFLGKFHNVKKVIWWLSLDFHFLSTPDKRAIKFLKKRKLPIIFRKIVELGMLLFSYSSLDDYKLINLSLNGNKCYHLYNCEYVKNYLVEKGIDRSRMSYLCGPIGEPHFFHTDNLTKEDNKILYNPAKGYEFTTNLISYVKEQSPEFKFIPLKNMTLEQMIKEQCSAKLYIDFGFFPGPERLPREAVLHKCNVLTSREGAAANNIDVPILSEYKFNMSNETIQIIYEKIWFCMKHYESIVDDFDEYRKKVYSQREYFEEDIKLFAEQQLDSIN